MTESLNRKRRITLPHVGIFADAVAVNKTGKIDFRFNSGPGG